MPTTEMQADTAAHREQTTKLAHALVAVCTAHGAHHRVSMEALLTAFASIAICHPCCATNAAQVARYTAGLIESQTSPASAPAGAAVH